MFNNIKVKLHSFPLWKLTETEFTANWFICEPLRIVYKENKGNGNKMLIVDIWPVSLMVSVKGKVNDQ